VAEMFRFGISINQKPDNSAVMHICYFRPGVSSGYKTRVITEVSLLAAQGQRVILVVCVPSLANSEPTANEQFRASLAAETGAEVVILPAPDYFDLGEKPKEF